MQLLVARIGKAHGLRGEVTVQLHTDAPGERLVPGAVFDTEPPSVGPLRLRSVRDHNGTTLLAFDGVSDRSGAQELRNTRLFVESDEEQPEGDAWYESDLVGLTVFDTDGTQVGVVAGLEPRPAQDLLTLRLDRGGEASIPFVAALVPEVDVDTGRVVIDPPPGLLELGEA